MMNVCRSTEYNLINVDQLALIIENGSQNVLIIDSRSFLEYNTCHIIDAINVCCSKIVKRRLQQDKISIKELIANSVGFNVDSSYNVIVYDQGSFDYNSLPEDSFISVLLIKLKSEFKTVNILIGGFLQFQSKFPDLCEDKTCKGKPSLTSLSQPCLPTTNSGPTRILPFLYLGSQQDALNKEVLNDHNITYELNVSTTCPKPDFVQDSHFMRIPVNDNYNEKLLPYFPHSFNFLEKVRESSGNVLVHCLAGISRSATVAIAYVMQHFRMSSEDAYRYVKSKRATISPNFNFLGQLLQYEEQLRKENILEPTSESNSSLSKLISFSSAITSTTASSYSSISSSSCCTSSSSSSFSSPSSSLTKEWSQSSQKRFCSFMSLSSSSRKMTLKLSSKTSRLKPMTPTPPEEVKSSSDQSPTTALAKLSFSSTTGSLGSSLSSNDRLKFAPQRSIDEILSSCPKVEKHSAYCSSLSTKRSEEPSTNLPSNIGTNISRTVEKRRADTFSSMFQIDLPIKSYSSYPSSSYKTSKCSVKTEDADSNPTQTKTSRLEKNFNSLPFTSSTSSSSSSPLSSSSSYSYSSYSVSAKESSSKKSSSSLKYESGNGSAKVNYSSQSNQIKISSIPTQSKRKFESKVKKHTKWYIGLEEDDEVDTCLKKSFSSSSKSSDQNMEIDFNNKIITQNCQRSDSSSTSGLGSEISDLNTECSSLIGDDDCEFVTLRRSIAERKFNPSIASHDSAYVSMLMESSSLSYIDPTLEEGHLKEDESLQGNTKCISDDGKPLLTESIGSSSSCNSKDLIRKNDLESSHDSGIQGSISSWSSSLASSIFLTSSTISTSTNQDQELKKRETEETNSSEIFRSLYRVNSYPNINDGSASLPSEMKTDKHQEADYTKLVCSCSFQPRNRYSLDLNCLFSVQSNRLALTSCGLSCESCPDFFNTSQPGCNNELTNRRRYCFRCSRYKSLTIDTGPKSQTPPPSDSSSHRSLFTSQNLIQVS